MPKTLFTDYIKIQDDFLAADQCRALIERFEASKEQAVRQADGGYSFVQLDITKNWPDVHAAITQKLSVCFFKYQAELDIRKFWPPRFFYENIRIQRYLPNGRDEFPLHIDVYNSAAAARFMTAILYLNETEGGETVFPELDLRVTPKAGKLLIFPPLWTYPHAGLPPKSDAKYILHTYLLYPPP